jgi:serine phosphatase RsbU (regulator of sigma subunit)
MALSISSDGTIESWNCGGMGWFSLAKLGEESRRQQNGPIGMGQEVRWDKHSWQAQAGDILLACTDGFFKDNRSARYLDQLGADFYGHPVDFEKIYAAVRDPQGKTSVDDDATMIVLEVL